MKLYSMGVEELTAHSNTIYQATIDGLSRNGEITAEQAEHLRSRYVMLTVSKGMFGKFLDKIFNTTDTTVTYYLAKL